LWLHSQQLFVDEACSGIISLLSIVACAVIYAGVKNRSFVHLILLAVAGTIWATLVNVVRISLIAYVLEGWGVDWSSGPPHEILSLILFLVAFLALLCTDQVLMAALAPITPVWNEIRGGEIRIGRRLAASWDRIVALGQPAPDTLNFVTSAPGKRSPAVPARHRTFGWVLPFIYAPLAAIQCLLLYYAFERDADRLLAVKAGVRLGAPDMPATLCGLSKTDFQSHMRSADNIQGKYSRSYFYRADDGTNYLVSFDFPFPGFWHELTECYVASGWQPMDRQVISDAPDENGRPWKVVEASFAKPGGQFGWLCFSEFDQFGAPYEPQRDWLREGSSFWNSRNLYLKERQAFQVQVWSERSAEFTPQQRQKAREVLLATRRHFRALIVEPSEGANLANRLTPVDPPLGNNAGPEHHK
jgi:exosortase/archaeosortase family protein